MIVLLGASGYVGQAFAQALRRQAVECLELSRRQEDYCNYETLIRLLKRIRPDFVVNAAGYTGKPNVDACETERAQTIAGNIALPLTISHACQALGIPWGHVSSGCIYNGAKVLEDGCWRTKMNLMDPTVRQTITASPTLVCGFSEADSPNFTFRTPPCSFYSGCKAAAEELLRADPHMYVWRLRIPFDHVDHPRNYLSKLLSYPKLYENFNSLSHLEDFAAACLALWACGAPFGTYNVTNPGFISTSQVAKLLRQHLCPTREFEFWESDEAFYRNAARAPRSNCILETNKLQRAGVRIRPVEVAIQDALGRWQSKETR